MSQIAEGKGYMQKGIAGVGDGSALGFRKLGKRQSLDSV